MKLQSNFALLDVMRGRVQLNNMIDKTGGHDLPAPIPVVIHGFIVGRWGHDDGISQEFSVDVSRVDVGKAKRR